MSGLSPVRDVHGHVVWRVKVTSEREQTCTVCGETTTDDYCIRCNAEQGINQQRTTVKAGKLVPTLSYLKQGEYET